MYIAISQIVAIFIGSTILGVEFGASVGWGVGWIAYAVMPIIKK